MIKISGVSVKSIKMFLSIGLCLYAGCQSPPADPLSRLPNPDEQIRYTPPQEFYTEECGDAAQIVAGDWVKLGVQMEREDVFDYAEALKSRAPECGEDAIFVDTYLTVLEAAGWSSTYNTALERYNRFSPGELSRQPLPDSLVSAP